jgi:hypothetical protein
MKLSFVVVIAVALITLAMGVVGYLVDRSTERHAGKGDH